ncbi:helix-turn-helix domain-containing protein [Enterococcus mediterraneensis]|uniref:helix-turn-helix domain-containing protein n=1 Tax=Enterococcus mediterraneensis TaxID=2364791 RepID=UPI000F04FBF5|nr:helix-turn-helix domain-containing protein [Enterococcus mediterraneensis]
MNYLSKYNQLKIEIIEQLDQINQEISYNVLCSRLSKNMSVSSLYTLCKELESDIAHVYPHHNVYLKVTPSTIQLIRYSSTLLYLYHAIFSSDLSYKIIESLFYKRYFTTEDFCFKQGVSLSTLRRKVKDLNEFLYSYQLHITVSSRVSLKPLTKKKNGEFNIRFYLFSFLYTVHRQVQNIQWIRDNDKLQDLQKRIFMELGIEFTEGTTDAILLWLYVIQVSALNNHSLHFSEDEYLLIDQLGFSKKPDYLITWTNEDWYFFNIVLCSFDLTGLVINKELMIPSEAEEIVQDIHTIWLESFEKEFHFLSAVQSKTAYRYLRKRYILQLFFPINEVTIQQFNFFNKAVFHATYPLYYRKFQNMWQHFENLLSKTKLKLSYFETEALLLSIYLVPPTFSLPDFKIYILSDLGCFYEVYVREQISNSLKSIVNLNYVDNSVEADLTVSLIPPPVSLGISDDALFLLKMPISERDLLALFSLTKNLVNTRYALDGLDETSILEKISDS